MRFFKANWRRKSQTGVMALMLVSIFCLLHESATACSMCRCGDDRFFINGAQRINGGNLIIMADYFGTSKTSGLGEEFESHDQSMFRTVVLLGLTERITLLGTLPYSRNEITEGGMTEENSGLADPQLTAITEVWESDEGDFEVNASLGSRIPLGKADATDAEGNRLDQHLQVGAGAWSVMAGVQAAHPFLAIPLFYSVSYQANGSNSHDFRYGNIGQLNVATQIPVTSTIRILAEANMRYAEKDKEESEFDPNSGGTAVYFSPGLRVALPLSLALRGQVQIPVIENLYGAQDEKTNVQIGLSITP